MSSRKKAFIFPGQGSQEVGMGKALHQKSSEVRRLFKLAEDITNRPIKKIAFEGPKNILDKTSNTQVALVVVSLGILAVYLKKHNSRPDFVAGHSVGEIAAAVAAGSMSEEDAISLAFERGLAMEQAGIENPGSMAAILGLSDEDVERIVSENPGAFAANYNISDSQLVISGDSNAVAAAGNQAEAEGGKRRPLDVTIPAHTNFMLGAMHTVREKVESIKLFDPVVSFVANRTGEETSKASDLAIWLPEQLIHPVKWAQSVDYMHKEGVREFVEIGPKKVLQGIVKRQLGGRDAKLVDAQNDVLEE